MEDKEKEIISESIKVSDILAKELAFWKKMFKWSCIISISFIFILLTACYVYVYNTETTIETTTLEGNQNAKIGTGNYTQLISSDVITNDNMLKIIQELNKTNTVTNK